MEKETATHSSILAWRILWAEEPGGLLSTGSKSRTRLQRLSSSSSRLVITSLPRSKHLLISWLQSPSAVILEPQKVNSVILSIVTPSICHEVMGSDAIIFVF